MCVCYACRDFLAARWTGTRTGTGTGTGTGGGESPQSTTAVSGALPLCTYTAVVSRCFKLRQARALSCVRCAGGTREG